MIVGQIEFPVFNGLRCLMMPYIQGDPDSVPKEYHPYASIIATAFLRAGDVGFLTIDESIAHAGKPHRGKRARTDRALHTEAGVRHKVGVWGGGWGRSDEVTLDAGVEILDRKHQWVSSAKYWAMTSRASSTVVTVCCLRGAAVWVVAVRLSAARTLMAPASK